MLPSILQSDFSCIKSKWCEFAVVDVFFFSFCVLLTD